MAETYRGILHPFAPVWDRQARALVLGTFPSVQSRANAFYYGHPQNRFWRLLATLFDEAVPVTVPEKQALLYRRHIALWDVLASCEIVGSDDGSIRKPVPNDVAALLSLTPQLRVFANGKAAVELYRRLLWAQTGVPIIPLPSTSPANAAWSLARLVADWQPLKTCVAGEP